MKEYRDLLRKGFVLTKNHCPKCKKILLRDPITNLEFCPICGYKESEKEILEKTKLTILRSLKEEKDIEKIYKALRSLYLIEKLLKSSR
jgi:uncharacterized Zn finger protein (UPF0148 family)